MSPWGLPPAARTAARAAATSGTANAMCPNPGRFAAGGWPSAGVPVRLAAATAAAAPAFAASAAPPAGLVPAPVAALVRQGQRGLLLGRLRLGAAFVLLIVTSVGVGLAARPGPAPEPPEERSG